MSENVNWEEYLNDYVKIYINHDVHYIANVGDEMNFFKLMIAITTGSGQLLNYTNVADEIRITF